MYIKMIIHLDTMQVEMENPEDWGEAKAIDANTIAVACSAPDPEESAE